MRKQVRQLVKTALAIALSVSMPLSSVVSGSQGVSIVLAAESEGGEIADSTLSGKLDDSNTEKESDDSSNTGTDQAENSMDDGASLESGNDADSNETSQDDSAYVDGGETDEGEADEDSDRSAENMAADEDCGGAEDSESPDMGGNIESDSDIDDSGDAIDTDNEEEGATDSNTAVVETGTEEKEKTDSSEIQDADYDDALIASEAETDVCLEIIETEEVVMNTVLTTAVTVAVEEEIEEVEEEDEELLYDWEAEWENDLGIGDICTSLDFSSSNDPAKVMEAFGTSDSKNNIEGPEGSNCAVDGATNWEDNGNLMIVDVASASDAESSEEIYDGAGETARMSLNDTNVFKFYLHDTKDWDRNTSIVDRQRIEIKTDAKNDDINSYHGEILTARWKFFLPEGYPLPDEGSFFHIFQTKATQGDESSMPVFTLSVTNESLTLYSADFGHVDGQEEEALTAVDIGDILGRWIEAEVTTYTAEKGYVYLRLRDVSDPMNAEVLVEEGFSADSWRRPEEYCEDGYYHEYDAEAVSGQMNRSKWGLYRKNDSPVPFSDMTMYIGDLQIIKRDAENYVFPDDFNPREQSRDIYWSVEPDPVSVLEGTDFSNIYLPSKVDVYVEGYDVETLGVIWEAGEYNQAIQGTYTIYGTLEITDEDEIENPNDVKASMRIIVTDDVSQTRVNWALGTEQGGTAEIKTIGGTGSNPSTNLIDGSSSTYWATNSALIAVNTDDNGGYRYWAAIDMGAERTFDEIEYVFGTIGSSKQFRLKNYTMYYTDDQDAYEELIGGNTGNPREKDVTPDPLVTEHGSSWEAIPDVYKENTDDFHEVTNNADHTFLLDEELTARYILVYGEIENVNATAGAIQTKLLRIVGNKDSETIPEITEIENPGVQIVGLGTGFEALGLPPQLQVQLADGTEGTVLVSWDGENYQEDVEGCYRITGTISFPDDQMRNPEYLKAEAVVIVDDSADAEKINWATTEQGATLVVVSEAKANEADWTTGYLIDEDDTTAWETNSSLMKQDGDCVYWAAIDFGQERNVDQLRLGWLKTNKRLKNYAVYYAEDTEMAEIAFAALKGKAGTIRSLDEITPDPLEESEVWDEIEGMSSDSVVANNTTISRILEESLTCRYILLRAELDLTVSAGAIQTAFLEAYGSQSEQTTEITGVVEPEAITVNYGTPFGEIDLPDTVEVKLENGADETIPVVWNKGTYSRTQTGTVWISGTLICLPGIANTEELKASLQINIEGSEIARRASVVFMSSLTEEYCHYDDVIVGSIVTAPVNDPVRDGFVFNGWYRDAATSLVWVSGSEKLTSSGLILYAGWTEYAEEETETGGISDTDDDSGYDSTDGGDSRDNTDSDTDENVNDNTDESEENSNSGGSSGSSGRDASSNATSHGSSSGGGSGSSTSVSGGTWVQDVENDDDTWKLRKSDGSYVSGSVTTDDNGNAHEQIAWFRINGAWYAFGADGYADQGWVLDYLAGKWYFIDINDGMKSGWHHDDQDNNWYYLDPASGAMGIGWNQIGGVWYYFNSNPVTQTWNYEEASGQWVYDINSVSKPLGAMYASETTPDGYTVDANGAWIQ